MSLEALVRGSVSRYTSFLAETNCDGTLSAVGHTYLLTARHNVEAARARGADALYARVNGDERAEHIRIPIESFFLHSDPTVDVCVAAPGPVANRGVHFWTSEQFASDSELCEVLPGTRIGILGLFSRHSETARMVPIVRTGYIASLPGEPVRTRMGSMSAYLIEAYSIGGLSGSPVFVDIEGGRRRRLLGVLHGHFDEQVESIGFGSINAGVGIVVPCARIAEVLNSPSVLEAEAREVRGN